MVTHCLKRHRSCYLLGVLLFASFSLFADEEPAKNCRDWQEADKNRTDLVVGVIDVEASDIFDTSRKNQDRWFHHLINRLHNKTEDRVVAVQVLLEEGKAFDYRKLEETERYIRSRRYIKDVTVKPVSVCDNQVFIEVRSRDNWTLTPSVSLSRSGGSNSSGISLEEHNLLGLGKALIFSYDSNKDRDTTELAYVDPQFLGTQRNLSLSMRDNSDGEGYGFAYSLPFYQLDSKKAWGVGLNHSRQEISLYSDGEVSNKIGRDLTSADLYYGWSQGWSDGYVQRYKAGWKLSEKEYFSTPTTPVVDSGELQSYPWLGYELTTDQYIKRQNFRTMGRVEDIQLGHRLKTNVGLLHEQLGSDNNYLRFGADYEKGFAPSDEKLVLLSAGYNAYVGNGDLSGQHLSLRGEWFDYQGDRSSLRVATRFDLATNLQADEQIILGGDNGLRGYPTAIQNGDKAALLTVEKRFYYNWYPWQLAKVGAVAFADAGTAWGNGNDAELLGDIGVGLRIVPTRSSSPDVFHIDLAIPTNTKDGMDDYQFIIETKSTF